MDFIRSTGRSSFELWRRRMKRYREWSIELKLKSNRKPFCINFPPLPHNRNPLPPSQHLDWPVKNISSSSSSSSEISICLAARIQLDENQIQTWLLHKFPHGFAHLEKSLQRIDFDQLGWVSLSLSLFRGDEGRIVFVVASRSSGGTIEILRVQSGRRSSGRISLSSTNRLSSWRWFPSLSGSSPSLERASLHSSFSRGEWRSSLLVGRTNRLSLRSESCWARQSTVSTWLGGRRSDLFGTVEDLSGRSLGISTSSGWIRSIEEMLSSRPTRKHSMETIHSTDREEKDNDQPTTRLSTTFHVTSLFSLLISLFFFFFFFVQHSSMGLHEIEEHSGTSRSSTSAKREISLERRRRRRRRLSEAEEQIFVWSSSLSLLSSLFSLVVVMFIALLVERISQTVDSWSLQTNRRSISNHRSLFLRRINSSTSLSTLPTVRPSLVFPVPRSLFSLVCPSLLRSLAVKWIFFGLAVIWKRTEDWISFNSSVNSAIRKVLPITLTPNRILLVVAMRTFSWLRGNSTATPFSFTAVFWMPFERIGINCEKNSFISILIKRDSFAPTSSIRSSPNSFQPWTTKISSLFDTNSKTKKTQGSIFFSLSHSGVQRTRNDRKERARNTRNSLTYLLFQNLPLKVRKSAISM